MGDTEMGLGQDLKIVKAAWAVYKTLKEGAMNLQGYRTIITAVVGVIFSLFGSKLGLTDLLASAGITQDQVIGTLMFVAMIFLRKGVDGGK